MTRLVFVPSPFAGPGSWRPTAELMVDTAVADYGEVSGPDWYEGVAGRIAFYGKGRPWTAVLHSGAGIFAPALAAASRRLDGFAFVDAILPSPGRSYLETAPVALADRLRQLGEGGRLPPWNRWFAHDPTPALLPDETMRRAFIEDLPCTPWGFLEAASPDDERWEKLPSVHLQLSAGYDDEAAEARRRGWVVEHADRHHLAMMNAPESVAAHLSGLLLAGRAPSA